MGFRKKKTVDVAYPEGFQRWMRLLDDRTGRALGFVWSCDHAWVERRL